MLSGIKPVKVHRAEEHFLARFVSHSAIMARMFAARRFHNSALAILWSRLLSAASLLLY
jgi:hypothetical protein